MGLRDGFAQVTKSVHGNNASAEAYGRLLAQVVKEHSVRRGSRSDQRYLGPSELGEECSRQVVGKMANMDHTAHTNHVTDGWASIVGTAIHAHLEEAYTWDNHRLAAQGNPVRWLTELRVTPDPGDDSHPGTADLYDTYTRSLVDHKCLGDSSRQKLIAKGPKRVYYVQLLLYRRGYQNLGLPVDKIVLVAWPRTKSSLDELYVWEHTPTQADEDLVDQVLAQTSERQALAGLVRDGFLNFMDITPAPSDDSCMFCPFYRPQAAYDNRHGCAGTALLKKAS